MNLKQTLVLLVLAILSSLSACASGAASLYGSYKLVGPAYDPKVSSPATLVLAQPNRYTFCEGPKCSTGTFSLLTVRSPREGRITFQGAPIEAFVNGLTTKAYGDNEILRRRGVQGSIDLDFSIAWYGTEIFLGVEDTYFRKQ